MQNSDAERITRLESQSTAYRLIIIALIADAWPAAAHRAERRERICGAIEDMFGRTPAGDGNHLNLHRILGEVERLFDLAADAP